MQTELLPGGIWEPIPGTRYLWIGHPDKPTLTLDGQDGIGAMAKLKFSRSDGPEFTAWQSDFRAGLQQGIYVLEEDDREWEEATGPMAQRVITEIPQPLEAIAESAAKTVAMDEYKFQPTPEQIEEFGEDLQGLVGRVYQITYGAGKANMQVVKVSKMLDGLRLHNIANPEGRDTIKFNTFFSGIASGRIVEVAVPEMTLEEEFLGPEICGMDPVIDATIDEIRMTIEKPRRGRPRKEETVSLDPRELDALELEIVALEEKLHAKRQQAKAMIEAEQEEIQKRLIQIRERANRMGCAS